jgi:predicted MFS family arabinose efflux permease
MGFNLMFSWSALDQFYTGSSLARISLTGRDLQTRVGKLLPLHMEVKDEFSSYSYSQRIMGYGGPLGEDLEALHQIRTLSENTLKLLREQWTEAPDPAEGEPREGANVGPRVCTAWAEGRLIFATGEAPVDEGGTRERCDVSRPGGKDAKGEGAHFLKDGRLRLSLPIEDRRGATAAYVLMDFPEHLVSRHLETAKRGNLITAVLISLVGSVLLAILLRGSPDGNDSRQRTRKKRLSTIIFLVTASAQLGASGLNILAFTEFAWANLKAETDIMGQMLKTDLSLELEQHGLQRAYQIVDEAMARNPQFAQLRLLDPNRRLIHAASRDESKPLGYGWMEEVKNFSRSLLDLEILYQTTQEITPDGKLAGYLSIVSRPSYIYEKLLKVMADALTVTIISLLFLVELMVLFFQLLVKEASMPDKAQSGRPEIMRPAAFLFVFGIDISVSFLPLHMKNLYEPMMGLSKDFVLGLPISVEFICVGLAILAAGAWVDRRGWHEPFIMGLTLAGGGVIYSWLAPTCLHFIVSRAIAGAGYGLSLMASQGFVIHHSDRKCKAHGLAQLFAGIYAGSICGSATGAMLAERFGYGTVFAAGGFIILGTLLYTAFFMRRYMNKPLSVPAVSTPRATGSRSSLLAFMLDRTVISLIFFSSLPAAIGVVGFLNYFSPIYLSSLGASQATIGRILMIYGISLIYLGPCISRYVDSSPDKRGYVFTGCLLGSMTFLAFYVFQGMWAAVLAVLLLGLSSSFVLASQSAYVLQLPVTRDLGEGTAIGIFRSSSRIGQALGPMVFGAVMARGNINDGITFFGFMYLMTAILFMLMNLRTARTGVLGEVRGV